MAHLSNVVALVTGASRGAGRGIALELGAAEATVHVTLLQTTWVSYPVIVGLLRAEPSVPRST
jgi:hypothetical protein